MIKSTYGGYTAECNGDVVKFNGSEREEGYICDFDRKELLKELRRGRGDFFIAQEEWNRITQTQISDIKSRLNAGDQAVKGAVAAIEKRTTDLEKQLDEMPGGYRNSQDIKNLKGRIERVESRIGQLNELLQPGSVVTVHSRLSDLEESVKLLATELANANKKISELVSGCGYARYSVCSKKLDTLEECCKNTVAAGKEVEKRIDFLESSSRNLSSRLDAHRANVKVMGFEISRIQKFMDKLHDF